MILKKNMSGTLILSLIFVAMVTGSCATQYPHTLPERTTCISTGQRLTLERQILDRRIEFFTTSGRHVRLTRGVTGCAILRIDGVAFRSWHRVSQLTKLQLQQTLDLESYLKLERMLRRCSPIRLSRSRLIIPFSSNPYRMVRRNLRPRSRTQYPPRNLRGSPSRPRIRTNSTGRGSKPVSTGRTRATTRTMGRNSGSSSMTNRGNGKDQTIY